MSFIDKVKSIILHPRTCWDGLIIESGVFKAFLYLMPLLLFFVITNFLSFIFFPNSNIVEKIGSLSLKLGVPDASLLVIVFLVYAITIVAFIFINTTFIFLGLKILKVESSYGKTFQVFIYSVTPLLLFSFLPFISAIVGIWVFFLYFSGLSKINNISYGKVLGADILGFILFWIVFLVIGLSCVFFIYLPYVKSHNLPQAQNVYQTQTRSQIDNSIPMIIGECVKTTILRIETRLIDASTGQEIQGSGSAIEYGNGIYGVSYETVVEIENSKVGDQVNLCLVSIPEDCPPGDDRGKVYKAVNLQTGESWSIPDSEHFCGGA